MDGSAYRPRRNCEICGIEIENDTGTCEELGTEPLTCGRGYCGDYAWRGVRWVAQVARLRVAGEKSVERRFEEELTETGNSRGEARVVFFGW